jgi:hypothetical protein
MPTKTIDTISKPDQKWNDLQDMIADLVVEAHGYPPATRRPAADHSGTEPQSVASPALANAVEPDQLERDIAEIERAVAALRQGDPDLEPWTNNKAVTPEPRKPRSVWFFVGSIWIATMLVTGAATLAITSLL